MSENLMNSAHKANSKAYEANYDRIFRKFLPMVDECRGCEKCQCEPTKKEEESK